MTHTVTEDYKWIEKVGDHADRTDSPEYLRSRAAMVAIVKTISTWPLGPPPWQDHHSGSIPLHDGSGWLFILDLAGSEWSGQFCLDPAKVDAWRLRVKRIVAGFPDTLLALAALGYPDADNLLNTLITNPTQIAAWVDGIFNASLPLPVGFHTGVLAPGKQQAGIHHYPKPVVDLQFLKADSFTLWVTDPVSMTPVAVTPVAPPGSGNASVRVAYATPGTALHKKHLAAHNKGSALVLPPSSPLAKQAFAKQGG